MEVALMNGQSGGQKAQTKDVLAALQPLLAGPLREAGSESDVDAFVVLCCMSAIPSGTEDPKALVRGMSDKFVETVKLSMCVLMKNRVAAQVAQFLFMEWCFRHGHLEEDWLWVWKSKTEGDLRYREKIPLQTLSGPSS
jgi:hypothetical protein